MGGSWVLPAHDAAGNMVKGPKPGAEGTRLHFVYDGWNRLAAVKNDNGGEQGTTIAEYRYDGLNRRIAKLVPNGGNWNRTDYYYNQSWQCLEERYGQNQAKETVPTAVRAQHLWDPRYIDAPVLRWRDTDGNGMLDETLYFCNDANMNVTALVNASTGSVVERYMYTPYGQPTFLKADWTLQQVSGQPDGTASAYANEILYCGYRFDSETGLYHVRHRYYHPTMGRFVQRDPVGYGDGLDIYEYSRGNPQAMADPFGLQATAVAPPPVAPPAPPPPVAPPVTVPTPALESAAEGFAARAIPWLWRATGAVTAFLTVMLTPTNDPSGRYPDDFIYDDSPQPVPQPDPRGSPQPGPQAPPPSQTSEKSETNTCACKYPNMVLCLNVDYPHTYRPAGRSQDYAEKWIKDNIRRYNPGARYQGTTTAANEHYPKDRGYHISVKFILSTRKQIVQSAFGVTCCQDTANGPDVYDKYRIMDYDR